MNRTGLIVLQAFGALSILPYPFVLLANIMSIAATGSNTATRIPWVLLSLYPFVWVALYVFAWRAMSRGATGLAFGLSSIPVFACLIVGAVFAFSWMSFGLGSAGIGNGGLHSTTYPTNNAVIDMILVTGQDIQIGHDPEGAVTRAIRQVESNPNLINVSVAGYGTPLGVALRDFSIRTDGTMSGDDAHGDRVQMVRALIAHGAHLDAAEAGDLHKSWTLRRALLEGPVTTATENPLVWRIVTHEPADNRPFDVTGKLPDRDGGPAAFELKPSEAALVNRSTRLHGTPLYAALLDGNPNSCRAIIVAGGRLSAEEQRDPAALTALQKAFDREPDLRALYQ